MTEAEMETVMSADINLDNLARLVPGLDQHPMFKIVKMQLKAVIEPEETN